MLSKLTKPVTSYQYPISWRNYQTWNLLFRNFLLKYDSPIKDKELHEKKKKTHANFFYFYVLKKLLHKFFKKFLAKGNS